MKTYVFIFVPVAIERTEIHVAVESEQRAKQPVVTNEAVRGKDYPFWTWFIDNPRRQPNK